MRPFARLALVALLVTFAAMACRPAIPPLRSLDPNADVVVPYPVAGGGEIRFTVRPRYDVGRPITIDLDVSAGATSLRGPVAARILASGLEGERLVRTFTASEFATTTVEPRQRAHVRFTWDGRQTTGAAAPAGTYSLSLDFVIGDEVVRLGTVIEVRAP